MTLMWYDEVDAVKHSVMAEHGLSHGLLGTSDINENSLHKFSLENLIYIYRNIIIAALELSKSR